jgi:hypothetical protein
MTAINYSDKGSMQLPAMIDLLVRTRSAEHLTDYPSPTDMHELLALKGVRSRTQLWIDHPNRLIAFAFVDDFNNLLWEIDPQHTITSLEAEVVAWGAGCLKCKNLENGDMPMLDASCREDDNRRIAFLTRHGFTPSPERILHMTRSLHMPIPEPELPAGFIIRPVSGIEEVQSLVDLHRLPLAQRR